MTLIRTAKGKIRRVPYMASCPGCGRSRVVYHMIKVSQGWKPPERPREVSRCADCVALDYARRYAPRAEGRLAR